MKETKKLSIVCIKGLENFLSWAEHIQGYEIRVFTVQHQKEIEWAVDWGDVVFFEWMNESMITGTKYRNIVYKRVLGRCHRYEVYRGYCKDIIWPNVHGMVFINDITRDWILDHCKIPDSVNMQLIPNGVDLGRFKFDPIRSEYDLAFMAHLSEKKGLALLLQAFYALTEKDMKYQLHIGGPWRDPCLKYYAEHMVAEMGLTENIKFYGLITDVNEFYRGKSKIICTSFSESQNMGVMEGMACGMRPVVHNFPGATSIYPGYTWNTIDDFIKHIQKPCDPGVYMDYVKENYSLAAQVAMMQGFIDEIAGG